MSTVFGVPLPAILGQLTLGLVNGSFYALLSLGLAVIFGLLGIVNFAHGAFYMLGAFAAYIGLQAFGMNYWAALVLAPLAVALLGVVVELLFLRRLAENADRTRTQRLERLTAENGQSPSATG